MQAAKNANILLVEDNRGDVVLVREALREINQNAELNVAENGVKALEYLRRQGAFKEASRPDMIILDLNLPQKNGLDVLREIKADPGVKEIPVAVFTTSQSHKDILKTYGLGATFFITKPLGFHEFMESVKSLIANCLKPGVPGESGERRQK